MSAIEMEPGTVFASYGVEAVAGRGGMGVVYRARHTGLDRLVALKIIAPEYAADQAFRERFDREARMAAAIDHPNVVPIYEAGEAEGQLFLAMRYVAGTDLSDRVRDGGPLPPTEAVAVVGAV